MPALFFCAATVYLGVAICICSFFINRNLFARYLIIISTINVEFSYGKITHVKLQSTPLFAILRRAT
jgi:hypothetical protein